MLRGVVNQFLILVGSVTQASPHFHIVVSDFLKENLLELWIGRALPIGVGVYLVLICVLFVVCGLRAPLWPSCRLVVCVLTV
jgi:hypothetical protein